MHHCYHYRHCGLLLCSQSHLVVLESRCGHGCEGTSLVVQWLRIHLAMQGMWVGSLVGEHAEEQLISYTTTKIRHSQINIF